MLNLVRGLMGGGKSFVAVNDILYRYATETKRPIYTNLPLNVESFLFYCFPRSSAERDSLRHRIHFLKAGNKREYSANQLEVLRDYEIKNTKKTYDEIKEFYFAVEYNSVIVLDEVATIFNSRNFRDVSLMLSYYINLHRHEKHDLFLVTQSVRDIDSQIRRKINMMYDIRNSLKENIFNHPLLKGIKYPFQFFIVRQYLTPSGVERDEILDANLQETHSIIPTKRKFENYNSFSNAILSKKLDTDATSDDLNQSFFKRCRGFIAQSWRILFLLGFAAGGLFAFMAFINGLNTYASPTKKTTNLEKEIQKQENKINVKSVVHYDIECTYKSSIKFIIKSNNTNHVFKLNRNYKNYEITSIKESGVWLRKNNKSDYYSYDELSILL